MVRTPTSASCALTPFVVGPIHIPKSQDKPPRVLYCTFVNTLNLSKNYKREILKENRNLYSKYWGYIGVGLAGGATIVQNDEF